MAPPIPTAIPSELRAAQTWAWAEAFADYPAGDGWVVTYYLRGAGSVNVVGTASGDDHAFTKAAADTAVAAGVYQYLAEAEKDGEKYTATSGSVVVLPAFATATAGALQTHAEKLLAALEAEITARVTGAGTAHNSHTILGRSIEFVPLADLYVMRNKYAAEVSRQRHGGKLPPVVIRFGGASGP